MLRLRLLCCEFAAIHYTCAWWLCTRLLIHSQNLHAIPHSDSIFAYLLLWLQFNAATLWVENSCSHWFLIELIISPHGNRPSANWLVCMHCNSYIQIHTNLLLANQCTFYMCGCNWCWCCVHLKRPYEKNLATMLNGNKMLLRFRFMYDRLSVFCFLNSTSILCNLYVVTCVLLWLFNFLLLAMWSQLTIESTIQARKKTQSSAIRIDEWDKS